MSKVQVTEAEIIAITVQTDLKGQVSSVKDTFKSITTQPMCFAAELVCSILPMTYLVASSDK